MKTEHILPDSELIHQALLHLAPNQLLGEAYYALCRVLPGFEHEKPASLEY